MTVKVDDHFGLAVDSETLNFARLPPGNSAEKSIKFENPSDHNVRVVILNHGPIAEWVIVSNYSFVLAPGQKKKVTFEVFIPSNATFGKYEGKAEIILKRELFR